MSSIQNPFSATLIVTGREEKHQVVWHFQNPLLTQEVSGEDMFIPYAGGKYTFSISADGPELFLGNPDHAVAKMIGSLSTQLSEAKAKAEGVNESSFQAGYQAALNDLQNRRDERFGDDDEGDEEDYEQPRCLCPDCTN